MIQIVLLGTGTANIDAERFGASTALVIDETAYLIDCGPGVMQRAAAAQQQGVEALDPATLTTLFLTHLHADHTTGLADLILGSWIMGRETPLRVFGPRGTKAMVEHLLAAYEADIHERVHGVEALPETGYQVEVAEVEPGRCFDERDVQVDAFRVDHGGLEAYGYHFVTPRYRIVISGDTIPTPAVVEYATGCDVLIHNAYSAAGISWRSAHSQDIHRRVLTSAPQLAEIAGKTRPGKLVLHHLESWDSAQQLIAEIRQGYDGEIVVGSDLEMIALE